MQIQDSSRLNYAIIPLIFGGGVLILGEFRYIIKVLANKLGSEVTDS